MIHELQTSRRRVLRGMLGGTAVTVGLPLLDCLLNSNGTALASGGPLPVIFGTWYQGLGFAPGLWEPKTVGANYEMTEYMKALAPHRAKLNIYSGMGAFVDGKPVNPHGSGPQALLQGDIPRGNNPQLPTIDSLVADAIGSATRFRSLEVACHGSPSSMSRRGGNVINPAESVPTALYTRIFGPEFKDPNAADFTPDPNVMVRRSVLSAITERRESLNKKLGASDRVRLDEYFTSVREMEKQLDLQLQRPAPLEACVVPNKEFEATTSSQSVENVLLQHQVFMKLVSFALACGQTRVFNVMLSESTSNLRFPGSEETYHMYTHEEPVNQELGYQPKVREFAENVLMAFATMVATLDAVKEGAGTLLDRTLVLYGTDTGFAKLHALNNIPIITAGGANGRLKTGVHVSAVGDPVTRVGLTIQQALGMPVGRWGTESNLTSKAFTEVLA